jgi:hypothetical protein
MGKKTYDINTKEAIKTYNVDNTETTNISIIYSAYPYYYLMASPYTYHNTIIHIKINGDIQ